MSDTNHDNEAQSTSNDTNDSNKQEYRDNEKEDSDSDDDSYREKNSVHSSDEEDDNNNDVPDGAPPPAGDSAQSVRDYLAAKLGIGIDGLKIEDDGLRHPKVLNSLDIDGVVDYIKEGRAQKIIVMAGAGISTSAGIPDFRSPGTGLYDNLQKYNLPNPMAIFDIRYFKKHPKPFFTLAKELYPGSFDPTPSHYFVKLLEDKGLLLRHFTQNIDTLERVAGIADQNIVEAHGAFHTGHCIKCSKEFSRDWIKDIIFRDEIPTCTKGNCGGYVKPDIVFFGENLPKRFFACMQSDFGQCDLLIIMGTSLAVQPFASLVDHVPDTCPRLLINMEKVGVAGDLPRLLGGQGLQLDRPGNYRDVALLGSCDDGCRQLADKLGWRPDLELLIKKKGNRKEK